MGAMMSSPLVESYRRLRASVRSRRLWPLLDVVRERDEPISKAWSLSTSDSTASSCPPSRRWDLWEQG